VLIARPLVDRLNDRTVTMTSALDPLAIDARSTGCCEPAFTGLLFALVIDVFEVEGVDVAWKVAIMPEKC
jgi:hypothetical protein